MRDAFGQKVPSGGSFVDEAIDEGGITALETEQHWRRAPGGRDGRGKRTYGVQGPEERSEEGRIINGVGGAYEIIGRRKEGFSKTRQR